MYNKSRTRERVEGWRDRRHTYQCIECQAKFQVDTLEPLPKPERLCDYCKSNTGLYTFTDKVTGKDKVVRAASAELATLRAWSINKDLTIKVEPNR